MKIGLNATCINDRPSGAKQRFIGINHELVKRLPDTEFVVYEPVDCRVASWFNGAPNVVARCTPLPSQGRVRKLLGGLSYWPSALRKENFSIFEGYNLPLVTSPTGRTLLTIHDIRGLRAGVGVWERTVFRTVLERSLKAADHVITVSETMKNEILGFYPGLSVSVIYNGLDFREYDHVSAKAMQEFKRKFSLPDEFVLAVGHFESRKNYLTLVDAFARLRDRGCSCSLVIVGNDSGERQAVEERVASAHLTDYVKILSDISDLEVRCAYKLCSMFVFPSSYEGFGIPILEAMAAGCPMALSDIPVFREITQDKGIYFQHDDIESMSLAIEKTLSSSDERARLVEYGNERVRDFSFQSLAAQAELLHRSMM